MPEFREGDDSPDLSMGLSPEEFNATITHIADTCSDELAYGLYGDCLDEDYPDQPETDLKFKRGLLLKFMGKIEYNRGDYDDALASYRRALSEITDFDELWSLELHVVEGHLLMHEFDNPGGAIGPYEEAVRIFENRFTGPESEIAPDQVFNGYTDVMSHLAAAYSHTDDYDRVRELNNRLARLGRVSGAIYGFDDCGYGESEPGFIAYDNKPIFEEVREKLTREVSLTDIEQQIEGLQSLERLIDRDDFLPEAPEEREHVLLMIYGRYGMLLPDLNQRVLYINRALKLAKRHGILVPAVDLYVSLGENQAQRGRPLSEQHKSMKRAMRAAEAAMDAGASAEATRVQMLSNLLVGQFQAMEDYIGVERLRQRLNSRGLELQSTMPGAARPHFN